MKKINYILLVSISLIFFGCEGVLGPQLQDTSIVKTETKWEVSPINDTKIAKVSFKEFSKGGELVKEIQYKPNGELESISEFTSKSGKRIEKEISFTHGDTSSVLIYNYLIENGKVTEKTTLDTSGNIIKSEEIKYDERGNVVKRLINLANGNISVITYQNIYTNGSLTSQYTFENGSAITQKDSIVYKNNDNYFEKITADKNGVIYFTTGYTINDKGNIISEIVKDGKGLPVRKYIYEFTYFE